MLGFFSLRCRVYGGSGAGILDFREVQGLGISRIILVGGCTVSGVWDSVVLVLGCLGEGWIARIAVLHILEGLRAPGDFRFLGRLCLDDLRIGVSGLIRVEDVVWVEKPEEGAAPQAKSQKHLCMHVC